MDYYIQGDAAKAKQIKVAFERLGYDASNWKFNVNGVIYYTKDEKKIDVACSKFLINLIKTHQDYKELELPVEPKFKVGDKVIYNGKQYTVTFVNDKYYGFSGGVAGCLIELQDQLLSPAPKPHYDIANFHAGMPVLVRYNNREEWRYVPFSHIITNGSWKFNAVGTVWQQCIPFEGNEHLLGTTDMCDEQYINW